MAEDATPERPKDPVPPRAIGPRHNRWFLVALYSLAFVWGVRNIYSWQPSWLDFLFPVGFAGVLWWWAAVDARRRGRPIPLLSQPWFFIGAGILVPGYVIWSRRWHGVGWLVLNTILWCAVATVVMHVGGVIVFGREWLRALGM